jgi:carboxylesterase
MRRLAGIVILAVVFALALLCRPLAPPIPASHPAPAADYAAAVRLVDRLRAADDAGPAIPPLCRTRFYSHGHATPEVVVLFHGLTNCPQQFDSLGRIAFARGANVLIPRLPRHGYADRMTDALAGSDVAELCAFTDRVLDAAHGLGAHVTVGGISLGGTLAAWAAQQRPDVARAVLIAPLLYPAVPPRPLVPAATRLAGLLPNAFVWWNDRERERLLGPPQVYPRFATRAIAATVEIGAGVLRAARRQPPSARSAAFILVGGDPAVDNAANRELARAWRQHGVRAMTIDTFPDSLALSHDIVDPAQVGGRPALTYPLLSRRLGP